MRKGQGMGAMRRGWVRVGDIALFRLDDLLVRVNKDFAIRTLRV